MARPKPISDARPLLGAVTPPAVTTINRLPRVLGGDELRDLLIEGMAGNGGAYHRFLSEISAHLRAYLKRRLTHFPEDVEDLVQETLLAIHTRRHTYDVDQPLAAWVFAIAQYKLIDLLRRRTRRDISEAEIVDESLLFSTKDAEAAEAQRDLGKLLELLPEKQRDLIVSFKLEGLSVAEVARNAHMSESAVKVALHRALKALATRLKDLP